jgi:hypothetical protein
VADAAAPAVLSDGAQAVPVTAIIAATAAAAMAGRLMNGMGVNPPGGLMPLIPGGGAKSHYTGE